MSDTNGYPGFFGAPEGERMNNVQFMVEQELARVSKMHLVKVMKVYPGDYSPTPTKVDVQPMVDMINPDGKRTAHGTIYGIISARHHSGGNAVLTDPVVGDVGMMLIADRDIQSLAANDGKQSGPGSSRRHDLSDGVYWGGVWTPAPSNYIDLRGGNIAHTTNGTITHTAQGDITHTTQGNYTINAQKTMSFGAGTGQDIHLKPSSGQMVYLGGDPADGGTFDFVMTASGPSDNVKAHVSGPV